MSDASPIASVGDAAGVLARYAELHELVTGIDARPVTDPGLVATVTPLLAHEARLLDAGAFDEWLGQWTDDAVLWVPHGEIVDPAADQSLLLDDRRRIGERIAWRRDSSAWGQRPPSRTVRMLGVVEAWADATGAVVTRSAIVLHEQRRGRGQQLVGHQIHELVGPARRRRTKVLVFPQLSLGVRNPSFVL